MTSPYQIAQDRNTALFEPNKPGDRLFELGGELYKSAVVGDRVELLRLEKAARRRKPSPGQTSLFATDAPKEGATKVVNGITYQFNANSRWERADKGSAPRSKSPKSKLKPKLNVIDEKPKDDRFGALDNTAQMQRYSDVIAGSGGKVLGSKISKDFRRKKMIDFIGTEVKTPEEMADLAALYRDPYHETFHYFFTKGDTVVGAVAVGSRMPGVAAAIPANQDLSWAQQQMEQVGADGYFVSHNHPSGDPSPSEPDIKLTKELAKAVPGFRGHVIVNHGKFAFIDSDQFISSYDAPEIDRAQPTVAHRLLGESVGGPDRLRELAKSLEGGSDMVTLITQQRTIHGILAIPKEQFYDRGSEIIEAFCHQTGAQQSYLVGTFSGADERRKINELIEGQHLVDAVDAATGGSFWVSYFAGREGFGNPTINRHAFWDAQVDENTVWELTKGYGKPTK